MSDMDTVATATPRLLLIDPATAVVGPNVRLDARLDKRFSASIRERGVLTPVVGHLNEDNFFVVDEGQRRVLAGNRQVWSTANQVTEDARWTASQIRRAIVGRTGSRAAPSVTVECGDLSWAWTGYGPRVRLTGSSPGRKRREDNPEPARWGCHDPQLLPRYRDRRADREDK